MSPTDINWIRKRLCVTDFSCIIQYHISLIKYDGTSPILRDASDRTNLHLDLQSPGPQQSFIDQVRPISHAWNRHKHISESKQKSSKAKIWSCRIRQEVFTYDQDVVELLHAVDFGQQLVDDSVMDAGAARHAASLLANGIDLIENEDVKSTIRSQL